MRGATLAGSRDDAGDYWRRSYAKVNAYSSVFCFVLRCVLPISATIKSIFLTSLKGDKWANLPKQKTLMFSAKMSLI